MCAVAGARAWYALDATALQIIILQVRQLTVCSCTAVSAPHEQSKLMAVTPAFTCRGHATSGHRTLVLDRGKTVTS